MNASAPVPTMTDELAHRLPKVMPGEAQLARIAFDRRFARWAAQVCQEDSGRIATARPEARRDAVVLDFSCVHGRLQASVPLSTWPALEMAARLTDASLARDVADSLLAAPLAAMAPVLTGLTLAGLSLRPAQAVPWEWICGGVRLGLHSIDDGVAAQLHSCLSRSGQADGAPLSGLQLPGRARIATRRIASPDLASLVPGDVVLCGSLIAGTRRLCHLSFGLGNTMQIPAELDLDSSELTLGAAPRSDAGDTVSLTAFAQLSPGKAAPAHGAFAASVPADDGDDDGYGAEPEETPLPLTDIGGLSLPVAFEIDTARIRLDDLAALGAGSVVPLNVAVRDATVRLVCHEQVVGTGQLVVIGDSLGVRIARMSLPGSNTSAATP